jgi:hypothetical protein
MDKPPREECFIFSTPISETVKHSPEDLKQTRNTSEAGSLKSLAMKVLTGQLGVKQSRDNSEAEVFHPLAEFEGDRSTPERMELNASRRRLEAADVRVAINEDGEMWIVRGGQHANQVEGARCTTYSPMDMFQFVQLEPHERKFLHEFKKRFGGTTSWKNPDQINPAGISRSQGEK